MSLYNNERPTNLSQVRGEEKVVAQIRAILTSGNIPNVSLFVGPRGTGKTTVARILAKGINCEHPTQDGPCGTCASCEEITSENSLDVIEIDAASNNKVEDVRGIIEGAKYAPLKRYKVYIIDEVHMLSIAAFNALLKLFEEPPTYCKFILCTTEEHKVPLTIISRCRKFYFERISVDVIRDTLADICQKYNIPFEQGALSIIARASDGCMRDAESLLEAFMAENDISVEHVSDVLGLSQDDAVFNILNGIVTGNIVPIRDSIHEINKKGRALPLLAKSLITALSDSLYFLQSNDLSLLEGADSYKSSIEDFCKRITTDRALELLQCFTDITPAVQGNDQLLEVKLISMAGYESCLSKAQEKIKVLSEKVECLENALFDGAYPANQLSQQVPDAAAASNEPALPEQLPANEAGYEYEIDRLTGADEQPSESAEPVPFPTEEFSVPEATPFDTDVLPGDIPLPEGTEVKGTISLFGDTAPVETESETALETETDTAEDIKEDNDIFGSLFSAFARQ